MTEADLPKAPARLKGTVELTTAGSVAVFLAALTLLIGALTQQLVPIVLALLFVLALVVEFVASAVVLSRLRRREVEILISPDLADCECRAQQIYEAEVVVRHRQRPMLRGPIELRVIASNHLSTFAPSAREMRASRTSEVFTVPFSADRPGQHCFYGVDLRLWGWLELTRCSAYVSAHRPLVFAPSESDWSDAREPRFALIPRRDGVIRSDKSGGFGLTRELRDYLPGDPVRRIAWKQYARFGKPLVREFEHEVGVRTLIAIDRAALTSADTASDSVGRLFAELLRELHVASGEGNSVELVGVWKDSDSEMSLRRVSVSQRQLASLSPDVAESLLSELTRPREVPSRVLLSRLAEVLYRYERLDFRTHEARGSAGSTLGFESSAAIDEELLIKWIVRSLAPFIDETSGGVPNSRRGWVELAWLYWGLAYDRRRGEPAGLDGFVKVLEHALEGRGQPDRLVYLTTAFERVPLREIESLSLSERARGIEIELVLAAGVATGEADFDNPFETIADWLLQRSARAASEDLRELNITTRGLGEQVSYRSSDTPR